MYEKLSHNNYSVSVWLCLDCLCWKTCALKLITPISWPIFWNRRLTAATDQNWLARRRRHYKVDAQLYCVSIGLAIFLRILCMSLCIICAFVCVRW